ncbi:DinB family protein [Streptomyces sp. CBMA123]|uniref:DinB family protein n=1 Tax=Streptomyces sp. CBMA123 TaxID=1896313 RepID=UPI001661C179|nr:DinB family protein [Streptomyces sp. CBMA123]MBD0692280.1 methyltransferase type 12 [Streptomyces sp. CBMA123]
MSTPEHLVSPVDAIVPDTKDWTWVLERPCADCGLDTPGVVPADVAGMIRANAASWLAVLAGDEDGLRRRPRPEVWSDLEYACHVRDVFRLFLVRLELMLDQDGPLFPNWDQDETAAAERYREQPPRVVAGELAEAGEALAAAFEAVSGERWRRTGVRSDGARFTVESFARYLIHDPVHHLFDVTGERV